MGFFIHFYLYCLKNIIEMEENEDYSIGRQAAEEMIAEGRSSDFIKIKYVAYQTEIDYQKLRNNLQGKYSSLYLDQKINLRDFMYYLTKYIFQEMGTDIYIIEELNEELKKRENMLKEKIAETFNFSVKESAVLEKITTVNGGLVSLDELNELYKKTEE